MTVCFKPLAGLFSQFKYLPLKYMGNLTIELELVSTDLDCISSKIHKRRSTTSR